MNEIKQTPMSVHGKVLTYANEVEGYCDKVENLPCVQK